MLHLNKITAALALGTALLASGQMATATTLHAMSYVHASYVSVSHEGIIMPGDMPGLSKPGKLRLPPARKPDFAPAGKPDFTPAGNADVRPASKHETKDGLSAGLFALDEEGFEMVEFTTDFLYASRAFEVTRAGTYELTLTDMVFPESLQKLGATVTTARDKLTEIFGSGSSLFDMDIGTHYLSYFAKVQTEYDLGLFGMTLQYYDSATTPVPVPGALWLLGSGLIGLAGITRGRKLR